MHIQKHTVGVLAVLWGMLGSGGFCGWGRGSQGTKATDDDFLPSAVLPSQWFLQMVYFYLLTIGHPNILVSPMDRLALL